MVRKSTGVYVIDRFNKPYELSEYQLFVREECAKLKAQGISIPGRGNTLVYVARLWQEKKAKGNVAIPTTQPIQVIQPIKSKENEEEMKRRKEVIEYSNYNKNNIIANNLNYFSNSPSPYRFGVQV